MTKTEVGKLLTYIFLCERRTSPPGRADVEAWHTLVEGIGYGEAFAAARAHFMGDSDEFLSIPRLRALVRVERLRQAPPETPTERTLVPDADPDDPAAFIQAVRDRRYLPPRDPADFGDRPLDVEGLGRAVPDEAPETPVKPSRPKRWWLPRGKGHDAG